MDPAALDWAYSVLEDHPDRRAIVVSHYVLDGNAAFSDQGEALYQRLKVFPNFFLMIGGHLSNETVRYDTFEERTVYTMLVNYQSRPNGGDGWLRLLEFSPERGEIHGETYSPTLDSWETDADSDFVLDYAMGGRVLVGTVEDVESGSSASVTWENLSPDTDYTWFVEIDDGLEVTTSDTFTFRTAAASDTGERDTAQANDSAGPAPGDSAPEESADSGVESDEEPTAVEGGEDSVVLGDCGCAGALSSGTGLWLGSFFLVWVRRGRGPSPDRQGE